MKHLLKVVMLASALLIVPATADSAALTTLRLSKPADLPEGWRFTRGSPATYVGADGILNTVGPNVPRFELRTDASGVGMAGYLAEGPTKNEFLHSSFEAGPGPWQPRGELKVQRVEADAIHGRAALRVVGNGRLLHRPLKLGAFAAPEFRGYFLTGYARRSDGKPLGLGQLRPFASTEHDGANRIEARRMYVAPVHSGPWSRVVGYLTPPNEGQTWHCGFKVSGDVMLDAVQLERRPLSGSEAPTSYIPTTDRPVARAPDMLALPPQALRWPSGEGTLVVWTRTRSRHHNGAGVVLQQEFRADDKTLGLSVQQYGGGLGVYLPAGGTRDRKGVPTDRWTQVVATWKDGRGRLYFNGVENYYGEPAGFPMKGSFGRPASPLLVGAAPANNMHLAGYVASIQTLDTAWDWQEAWRHYRETYVAAGGDASALKAPKPPERRAERPKIPERKWVRFRIQLPESAPTSIALYNATEELVRTLWEGKPARAGAQDVEWDTGDDAGRRVPPGTYTYKVLQNTGVKACYVATPGNGRVPQRDAEHEIAGVHGLWPRGVAVDRNGDIYLLAAGHGVGMQKYSSQGNLLWMHAPLDTSDRMTACAVDGETVYAAGAHLCRVNARTGKTIRRSDGTWRVWLGEFEMPKVPRDPLADVREAVIEGQLLARTNVRGIAVRGDRVYVSLYLGNRIEVFDKNTLAKLSSIELDRPAGLAFDSGGRLLAVSDTKVVRLTDSGKLDRVMVEKGLAHPYGLAVGPNDDIYVTDMGDPCRLLRFGPDGCPKATLGRGGRLDGRITADKLYAPTGVAVGADGRTYIVENLLNRLMALDPQLKVRWCLYGGAYMENASLLSDDPTVAYGLDGYNLGALYEYKVDLDTGRWTPERWWWLGHRHPTREVMGFMVHGQQTHTIQGRRYLFTCHKTVRVYRIDGDELTPVARVGGRFRYFDKHGNLQAPSGPYPIWVDLNGDGLAQEDEVEYRPERDWKIEPDIGFSHDDEVTPDGTIYWGNFALPLEQIDARGVPHYTWKTASVAGPDFAPLRAGILEGVAADREGNRYYEVFWKDDSRRQPGIGHWPKRVIRCHVQKYAPDGRLLWTVGHKAPGAPEPGGIHAPTCISCAAGLVFLADEVGPVHIWDKDGLYVATVLANMALDNNRSKARAKGYLPLMAMTIGEFWSMNVVEQPGTGRIFLVGQSHEFGEHIRIYEIQGLDRLVRLVGKVTVQP